MKKYMHRNRGIKGFIVLLFCLLCINVATVYASEEKESEKIIITDGEQEYGSIYGSEYSDTDDTKWLTVKLAERGLRIVNAEGQDIVLVDQYGSVYINGQPVNNFEQEDNNTIKNDFSFGFMYFLIVVSLGLNVFVLIKKK